MQNLWVFHAYKNKNPLGQLSPRQVVEMSKSRNKKNEWKQINRSQRIWNILCENCDLEPDDYILLINALDTLGYEVSKKGKNATNISDLFFGVVED